MHDFIFDDPDGSGTREVPISRLLELVSNGNDDPISISELDIVERTRIAETLWIFAQIFTMEFDYEN